MTLPGVTRVIEGTSPCGKRIKDFYPKDRSHGRGKLYFVLKFVTIVKASDLKLEMSVELLRSFKGNWRFRTRKVCNRYTRNLVAGDELII